MFRQQLVRLPRGRGLLLHNRPAPISTLGSRRSFASSSSRPQSIPIKIHGQGRGSKQIISVPDKSYTISTDTYPVLGGEDSAPSPVAYCLASLGSCNQVTGSVVAKDHGIAVGEWTVTVEGQLPTEVLVNGEQGNPNWKSVDLKVHVQTDIGGGSDARDFKHFAAEVERRCPITQLFKLSGVEYTSQWINERL